MEQVKAFVIKSLELRKAKYTEWKFHNIPMAKKNIAEWQKEIDTNQEYSGGGMMRMKVYKDTNEKLIKQEKEWLTKAEKIVQECDEAIEYVLKNL